MIHLAINVVLPVAAVAANVWADSPRKAFYLHLWNITVGFAFASFVFERAGNLLRDSVDAQNQARATPTADSELRNQRPSGLNHALHDLRRNILLRAL